MAAPPAPLPDARRVSALMPAAGAGERLGLGPKAFLEIGGQPLVAWVAARLARVANEVVVAAPPGALERVRALCPAARVIEGGSSRQDSVARLVATARHPLLLLHDAARPFASEALLRAVVDAARRHGVAGAFVDPAVPVARLDSDGFVRQAWPAQEVRIFQSPQAFDAALLRGVLARARAEAWQAQSTMQLVLRAGHAAAAVPGEATNLKLTHPADRVLAANLVDLLS